MPDVQYKNTFTTIFNIVESPEQAHIKKVLDDQGFWNHCATLVDALVQAELVKRLGKEN